MRNLLLCLCFVFVTPAAFANSYQGRVDKIFDGDSFMIKKPGENRWYDVRMLGIDSPEKGQPYAEEARETLKDLIYGRTVTVQVELIDFHGREIVTVYLDEVDINLKMISLGYAWFNEPFEEDVPPEVKSRYRAEAKKASQAGIGLWLESHPTPPWEFRWAKRKKF